METITTTSALISIFLILITTYIIVNLVNVWFKVVKEKTFFSSNNDFDLLAALISIFMVFSSVYSLAAIYSQQGEIQGFTGYIKPIFTFSILPLLFSLFSFLLIQTVVKILNKFSIDKIDLNEEGSYNLKSWINGILIVLITYVLLGNLENLFLSFLKLNNMPV